MFVEIALEPTYPVLPKLGESQLRVYNGRDCDYTIGVGSISFELQRNKFHLETIPVPGDNLTVSISALTSTPGCNGFNQAIVLESGMANGIFIERNSILPFEDNPDKSRQGRPAVRVLTNFNAGLVELSEKDEKYEFNSTNHRRDVVAGDYTLTIAGRPAGTGFTLKLGGVYTFIVNEGANNNYVRLKSFTFNFKLD